MLLSLSTGPYCLLQLLNLHFQLALFDQLVSTAISLTDSGFTCWQRAEVLSHKLLSAGFCSPKAYIKIYLDNSSISYLVFIIDYSCSFSF